MSVSFNPHSPWKKGDIIKTEDLDRYENGIVNLINASDQMSATLGESATSGPIGLGNNTNLENADVKDSENKDKKGYLITAGALIDASNIAKGWVRLNSDGIVPSELLPSYVDDVLIFEDYNHFPGVDSSTGEIISEVDTDSNPNDSHAPAGPEEGKIYIAADTGYTYRWYDKEVNNERECGYALIGVADLDYTDSNYPTTNPETTNWNKYYVKRVTQADGKINVEHALFNPSITWTSAVSNVNNGKPSINISIAGNPSTVLIPDEASTNVYGITKLSNAIDSNSEVLAATPKAVKDALESLDVDNLSSEDAGYDANKAHITGFATNKTLASLTETDGKINASFQNISITSDQISNSNTNEGDVVKLNSARLIPSNLLPSYVDDVIEGYYDNGNLYSEIAHTNIIAGETGKIYVDLSTNNSYRWAENAGFTLISSTDKADKVSNATSGHFAALDSNGNLIDSGHKHSDYITDISTKANKSNTVLDTNLKMGINCTVTGTYSIAIGNQASATGPTSIAVGNQTSATDDYSIALGVATSANGEESIAIGSHTIAAGQCSHAEGTNTKVYGKSSFVFGEYNVIDNYDNIPEWVANTNYIVGDQIKRISGTTTYTYTCIEANNDSTFTSSHWSIDYRTRYVEIVGNGRVTPGSNDGDSNARALDWRGNEYLNGDLYVNCNADSTNGTKVATINDLETKADKQNPVFTLTPSTGNIQFSDGTNTVTFTMSDLQALYELIHPNT